MATMPSVLPQALPASIPSPEQGVWHLGPVPVRAYALAIIIGILVAIWLGTRRWAARGGAASAVSDIAIWAVPLGIIGARIYHVITDNQLYFGEGRDPWRAFEIWEGGIGIWGAIAGGGVGVWIACRRRGIPFAAMADALAPGILIAQGIGRWGNYFNQELFGKPTDLPWALEIDPGNRPEGYEAFSTFHPTFLYESLWAFVFAAILIWADRRFRMGHGRVFALYVAGYTLGRSFFEYLRIDPANEILGLRVNQWVSGLLCLAAIVYIIVSARRRPGREAPEELLGDEQPRGDDAPVGTAPGAATPAEDEADGAGQPTVDGDAAGETDETRAEDETGAEDRDDVSDDDAAVREDTPSKTAGATGADTPEETTDDTSAASDKKHGDAVAQQPPSDA